MSKKNRPILLTAIISGIISFIEITSRYFFPEWTFVNNGWVIACNIIGYFAFGTFVLSICLFFNAGKIIAIPLGLLLFLICFIESCSELFPIDTVTHPVDVATLRTDQHGNKLIIQQKRNAKTNYIIQDTVWVKDYFIFRKIIQKGRNPKDSY